MGGYARNKKTGVSHLERARSWPFGFTLFTPVGDKRTYLVDMEGQIAHKWDMPYLPALHAELLPNSHLLYAGQLPNGPMADFTGAGGVILEVDWNGKVLWKHEDPHLHHTFCRMDNGNTLVTKWIKTPEKIAKKVEGGMHGKGGDMWCDAIQEITPSGKVAWEWLSHEHLDPELDSICLACDRRQWTEINSLEVLPDGNILANFMRTHHVAIIDKKTGKIKWRWGLGEVGHPHSPTALENGNILVFDNGRHAVGLSFGYSRLLEVDPKTNKIKWEYLETPMCSFYSSIMGSCQQLPKPVDPNGRATHNILVCEGINGRIFEITSDGRMVWEYVSPFYHETKKFGRTNMIFRAKRYELTYPGLKGQKFTSDVYKEVVKKEETKEEDAEAKIRSRLEDLGY